jgi:hypothetical protein
LSNSLPVQSDVATQAAPQNLPTGGIGNAVNAASVFLPADQSGIVKAAPPFTAPKAAVVVNAPNIRGVEQHAIAPTSTPASASTAVPDLNQQSQLASQTPFSIFFSGPGPGMESAAGTLPKMILPGAGSANAGNHNMGAESGASPQMQANVPRGGCARNPAPQNLKDQAVQSSSSSPQALQPQRPGGDGNAVSRETAMAQIASAAAPAVTTTAVVPPAGTPPALGAGSSAKSGPSSFPPASGGAVVETLPVPVPMAGPVQMAQLISRVQQAEMRIGMNTSAFGSVEVRAVVHANDVGLVVGSEKGDLRTLLSNELPAITNTLQEQNLRLHSVNFMQGFAFSNNASGGGDSQQRPFIPQRAATDVASRELKVDESSEQTAPVELRREHNTLSILA